MTALLAAGLMSALPPEGSDGSFWLPPGVSTVARHVDWLFGFTAL